MNPTSTKSGRSRQVPAGRHGKDYNEDAGRFIRCWNCGFVIDMRRLRLPSDGSGVSHYESVLPSMGVGDRGYSAPDSIISTMDYVNMVGLLMLDAAFYEYVPRGAYAVNGCPFCGCTNLP